MPYVVFIGCCLIWGSTFLAIRIGNEAVPPVWAATIRLVLAAPLLTLLVLATRQRFPRGPALRGALLFGIFNFGVNMSLLYWGERDVTSGIAAVLYATVPLSTALIAAGMRVERLVPSKVAAAIVAIVCAAVSLVIGEDHSLPSTLAGWGPIVYLTLAGSLGAYVLYTWLVQHWPVTNASMVGVVVPVLAVILGAGAKQEQRSPESYLGAAVVLVAVVVALRPWAGTRYAGGPAV